MLRVSCPIAVLIHAPPTPPTSRHRYLGGVLDYTGELNRFTVGRATQRDVAAVQRARDVVDSIQGQFLQMDLRNGALR